MFSIINGVLGSLFRYSLLFLPLCFANTTAHAAQQSAPYFLSWSQKGELIKSGYINNDNVWYNVHLVPGYTGPRRYSAEHWSEAGNDLSSYGAAGMYRDLYRTSREAFSWGTKSSMLGYAINGSSEAWRKYLFSAQNQTRRRVFGWWLAYPWAGFKGALNTGWRYLAGTTGMVGAYASGALIVPSYYVLEPAVAATWHAGFDGVALPLTASAWNTVISPPLAMLGQRPAPERVDGFWVSIIKSPHHQVEEVEPATPKELAEMVQLSQL